MEFHSVIVLHCLGSVICLCGRDLLGFGFIVDLSRLLILLRLDNTANDIDLMLQLLHCCLSVHGIGFVGPDSLLRRIELILEEFCHVLELAHADFCVIRSNLFLFVTFSSIRSSLINKQETSCE